MNRIDLSVLKEIDKEVYKIREELLKFWDKLDEIAADQEKYINDNELEDDEIEMNTLETLEEARDTTDETADGLLELTNLIEEILNNTSF